MRKQKQNRHLSDTAPGTKRPTFRASPSEGTAENHLQKNSSELGWVIGKEHARAQAQHASGAYGPGRIL